MKILILFLSFNLLSNVCPTNISNYIKSCTSFTCVKDDSKELKNLLGSNETFKTEVEVKRMKKACYLKFKSEYTGIRVCKFPKKYLPQMASVYGDLKTLEGIKLFETLKKLSEAKDKFEFEKYAHQMNDLENEVIRDQVKLQKIFKKNPKIKKY